MRVPSHLISKRCSPESKGLPFLEPVQELLRVLGVRSDRVVPLWADVVAGELDRFEFCVRDFASSPESVGEFWFGEGSEVVTESSFNGSVGAEAV